MVPEKRASKMPKQSAEKTMKDQSANTQPGGDLQSSEKDNCRTSLRIRILTKEGGHQRDLRRFKIEPFFFTSTSIVRMEQKVVKKIDRMEFCTMSKMILRYDYESIISMNIVLKRF